MDFTKSSLNGRSQMLRNALRRTPSPGHAKLATFVRDADTGGKTKREVRK